MRPLAAGLLVAALCPAPTRPPARPAIPHDAYLWQRHWTPALTAALHQSAPLLQAWRVLAAEASRAGSWQHAAILPEELTRTARPVIAVFRIDGRQVPKPAHVSQIAATLAEWRQAGVALAGVEIDYDCPASQLSRYADWLASLRRSLPEKLHLSITALPAWLGHRDLPTLLRQADESVLQVHAVMNPRRGLFQAAQARRWIEQWSAASPRPFRVALPNYGSRVTWNAAGQVTAIESEEERLGTDPAEAADTRELYVTPGQVLPLLDWLRDEPPARFGGIVWFRLPAAGDARAWSLRSWHAVLAGRAGAPRIEAELADGDLVAVNRGTLDGDLPATVDLAGHGCELADALPGYRLERVPGGLRFVRQQGGLLRAGDRRTLGWARCAAATTKIALKESR